jgi:hypothetical protein
MQELIAEKLNRQIVEASVVEGREIRGCDKVEDRGS